MDLLALKHVPIRPLICLHSQESDNLLQNLLFPQPTLPKKKTGPLDQLFDIKGKNDLDTTISAFFYRHGIPFNVARSAEYHDMVQALINYRLSYVPPSYDELRTTLLEAMCFSLQQRRSSFLANIYETGCSLVLDGWTDPCGRPLVNFIIVTPDGAMFYDCINTFGKSKDGKTIFLEIQKVIDRINPAYITNVVTDNAVPMVSAGRLIEKKFRRIVWTRCHSHCVDLLLEDLQKREPIKTIISDSRKLVQFIKNQSSVYAIFKKNFSK
ncbi:hypothetical protein GEMRC1_010238 [Eukaryota sp. GEM-RC1]